MNWFLFDRDLRHEGVNQTFHSIQITEALKTIVLNLSVKTAQQEDIIIINR